MQCVSGLYEKETIAGLIRAMPHHKAQHNQLESGKTMQRPLGRVELRWACLPLACSSLYCPAPTSRGLAKGWPALSETPLVALQLLISISSKDIAKDTTDPRANQTLAFRLNLNFKIFTKPCFRFLTKIKLQNLNQASAAKYWPNFSFKISSELQL